MSLSAMKCRRCGSALEKTVTGGVLSRVQAALVCPRYRFWHLFLHDAIVLGR